ncbi:hypothetical protein BJX63DRAFT_400732 [Aspergillus granulosus]|uniref:Uncharacterized protein n=1 Tax=Aspergillus granulosus TaxID=176169 RepID=A0ABR4H851_9EURO
MPLEYCRRDLTRKSPSIYADEHNSEIRLWILGCLQHGLHSIGYRPVVIYSSIGQTHFHRRHSLLQPRTSKEALPVLTGRCPSCRKGEIYNVSGCSWPYLEDYSRAALSQKAQCRLRLSGKGASCHMIFFFSWACWHPHAKLIEIGDISSPDSGEADANSTEPC